MTLAIEHANLNDWDITVAVCDTAGVLIAFMRTKNVILRQWSLLLIKPTHLQF